MKLRARAHAPPADRARQPAARVRRRSTWSARTARARPCAWRRRSSRPTASAPASYLSPHLASFAERIRIGDADLEPDALRRRGRARRRGGGQGRPHAVGRRARDPVRAAHRRRVLRVRRARRGGGGGRGRPRRPPRRHQRARARRSRCSPTSASSTRAGSVRRSPTSRARSSRSWRPARRSWSASSTPEAEAEVAKVDARVVRADRRDGAPFTGFQRSNFAVAKAAAASVPGGRATERSTTPRCCARRPRCDRPRALPDHRRGTADDLRRRAQPVRRRRARRRAARRRARTGR